MIQLKDHFTLKQMIVGSSNPVGKLGWGQRRKGKVLFHLCCLRYKKAGGPKNRYLVSVIKDCYCVSTASKSVKVITEHWLIICKIETLMKPHSDSLINV